jgi:predicted N-acetyltransferase YhbS
MWRRQENIDPFPQLKTACYTFVVTIDRLSNVPEHTETVAKWIFDTFPHEFETTSFKEWLEVMQHPERVTFVVTEKGQAIGTASLDFEDLPPRDDLTPWLASVYVLPKFRVQGMGEKLVETVTKEAKEKGFSQLYLHTSDRADFYAKRGWKVLTTVEYWGKTNTVMIKALTD